MVSSIGWLVVGRGGGGLVPGRGDTAGRRWSMRRLGSCRRVWRSRWWFASRRLVLLRVGGVLLILRRSGSGWSGFGGLWVLPSVARVVGAGSPREVPPQRRGTWGQVCCGLVEPNLAWVAWCLAWVARGLQDGCKVYRRASGCAGFGLQGRCKANWGDADAAALRARGELVDELVRSFEDALQLDADAGREVEEVAA